MAGIMAVAAVVALRGLKRGVQESPATEAGAEAEEGPDADLYPPGRGRAQYSSASEPSLDASGSRLSIGSGAAGSTCSK